MWVYFAGAVAAVILLGCGWFASAWVHQRRIDFLQLQMKVMRQTANAHNDQARRQIGQLQAELATRPPRPVAPPEFDEPAESANAPRRRPVAPDKYGVLEDGFPQTAIINDGYAPTVMMN